MQTEAQQVVGLFVVVDHFLQFIEDVAVQETEERAVDVQCVDSDEPGAGKQRQSGLQGPQGARWP